MDKHRLHSDRCLSLDMMRLYQERQLPDKEMHHVERHLLDCELCSDVLEGLEAQDIPVINSITVNVNSKVASLTGTGPQPIVSPSLWSRFKWYFIVPAAIVTGWFAWNGSRNDSAEVTEKPVIAGKPAPVTGQEPGAFAQASPGGPAHEPVIKREPQGVEKVVPSPATDAPVVNVKKPGEKIPQPVVTDNISEGIGEEEPGKVNETPLPVEEKAAEDNNADNSNNNKKLPPSEINHAPLKLIEVKVISKVAAAGGTRKSSKGGQLGGSKAGRVDDGMQPHEMPVFYGGDEAMKTWLIRNFQNPVKDKSALKGKTTAVIFDVSAKGKIDNIEVTKSLSKELDAEVIRLVESMPQWKAALKKGTITVVLAITFK